MPKQIISTPEAPRSPMYSQAVKAGNTIYVAGTTGIDVTTGEFAGPMVKEQARQALLNCQAILRAAGGGLSDAVMVHTLLIRPEDADDLAEVFDEAGLARRRPGGGHRHVLHLRRGGAPGATARAAGR
jgi:2-iminobutanoate/2-iminopropanoate deaminase